MKTSQFSTPSYLFILHLDASMKSVVPVIVPERTATNGTRKPLLCEDLWWLS